MGIPEELKTLKFVRTEQRGGTLLLRKELISARDISSTGVLYSLLVTYQPGGPGERSLIEIALPDPTLLAAALEKVTQLVNGGEPQAFRVAQARTQLGAEHLELLGAAAPGDGHSEVDEH